MRRGLLLASVLLAGLSLSACSNADESDTAEAQDVFSGPGHAEESFGPEFAASLKADPQSEPREVHDGDLPPLSLTSEPVAIN